MHFMKRMSAALIAASLCLCTGVQAGYSPLPIFQTITANADGSIFISGDFVFMLYGDHAELVGFGEESSSAVIPDTASGLPVTVIASEAFYYCSGLTSVTIPDSVTKIESDAFYASNNLAIVNIPASVTSIGNNAFYHCRVTDVYYSGTQAQWDSIAIGGGNDLLTGATLHTSDGSSVTPQTTAPIETTTTTETTSMTEATTTTETTSTTEATTTTETTSTTEATTTTETTSTSTATSTTETTSTSTATSTTETTFATETIPHADTLQLDTSSVHLLQSQSTEVNVLNGSGNYTVSTSDSRLVAYWDGQHVIISTWSDESFSAQVTVTDQQTGVSAILNVQTGTVSTTATTSTTAVAAEQTTTSATQTETQPTTTYALGDVNNDGNVNAEDAAMILTAAANLGTGNSSGLTPEQEKAADVDRAEGLNATDAAYILMYAAAQGAGNKETFEAFLVTH